MQTLWAERFAQRTQRMKSSAVRELLKLTELPDIISFAGGLPAPESFPSNVSPTRIKAVMDAHWARRRSSTARPKGTARCAN